MPHRAAHVPPVESGSYPVRQGCAVRPWVDGEPAFRRICEAVEAARRSVWVTVAFLERDVQMPGGRGTFFDVLDRAAARGVDVRALFWRSPEQEAHEPGVHFSGTEEERAWLARRGARFAARWDHLPGELCHHQKSWLSTPASAGEVAFVGGINLDGSSVSGRGHAPRRVRRRPRRLPRAARAGGDGRAPQLRAALERGERARPRPTATGRRGATRAPLLFPARLSPPAGDVPVQITRTVSKGRYRDGTPAPGRAALRDPRGRVQRPGPVPRGDRRGARARSTSRTRRSARCARSGQLKQALERGVEVVFLAPGNCHPAYAEAKRNPDLQALLRARREPRPLPELHPRRDRLATRAPGAYHEVYVHAKIMLVDDAWATIGSTNVAERSFRGDTELNASLWHGDVVRELRRDLLAEHLGVDTAGLGRRGGAAALPRARPGERRAARARRAPAGPRLPPRRGALRLLSGISRARRGASSASARA